jgi:hypothetical protein
MEGNSKAPGSTGGSESNTVRCLEAELIAATSPPPLSKGHVVNRKTQGHRLKRLGKTRRQRNSSVFLLVLELPSDEESYSHAPFEDYGQ